MWWRTRTVSGRFRPRLYINWPGFQVRNKNTPQPLQIPSAINLNIFHAWTLRKILKNVRLKPILY